ncbi:MAG: hypothetical protein RLZZ28_84 [Bacteroidota bacterium]
MLLLVSTPIVYTAFIYASLPATIPTHFDINGKPNGFGSKDTIWFITVLLSVIALGLYLLMTNLAKIDPKKTAGQTPELYQQLAIVLVGFLTAVNLVIVYSTQGGSIQVTKFLLPLLGLFFMALGFYMPRVKPNYFVGFRLPWTLENEENWMLTHRLVGKLWVPGGLFIFLMSLFLPSPYNFILFLLTTLVITIIPVIFSYRHFKKNRSANQ